MGFSAMWHVERDIRQFSSPANFTLLGRCQVSGPKIQLKQRNVGISQFLRPKQTICLTDYSVKCVYNLAEGSCIVVSSNFEVEWEENTDAGDALLSRFCLLCFQLTFYFDLNVLFYIYGTNICLINKLHCPAKRITGRLIQVLRQQQSFVCFPGCQSAASQRSIIAMSGHDLRTAITHSASTITNNRSICHPDNRRFPSQITLGLEAAQCTSVFSVSFFSCVHTATIYRQEKGYILRTELKVENEWDTMRTFQIID